MQDQPTAPDEDQAWHDAHAIAWIGASNPRAVEAAVARWTEALGEDHLAVRAMSGHLNYLQGIGLGPDPDVLDAVVDNARRLGLITDAVALRVSDVRPREVHDCPREAFLGDPITVAYGVGSEMVHLVPCAVCDAEADR